MHTLTVRLKQHTPLIHFQHDQDEATLRASEVKPKLDKYLFEEAIEESFEECKTFLIGYSEMNENSLRRKFTHEGFRALDYMISINPVNRLDVSLRPRFDNDKRKYISDDFPMILSNMGGKDSLGEIADFSMYETVEIYFRSKNEELLNMIADWSDLFFATRNFGQRQDKGFGSFTVVSVNGDNRIFPKNDLPNNTNFLKITFPNRTTVFDKQKRLFQTIDFYWKVLKSGINYSRNGQYNERYIKAFLWMYLDRKNATWEKRRIKQAFDLTTGGERPENQNTVSFARAILGCPDKFEYKNKGKIVTLTHTADSQSDDFIARIPSPIIFKPVFAGDVVRIYLLVDNSAVEKLRQQNNLIYRFECDRNSLELAVDPDIIDFNELLRTYHVFLNDQVKQCAFDEEDDLVNFTDDNDINGRRWFIPLDFNWRRILNSPSWVEMYICNNN